MAETKIVVLDDDPTGIQTVHDVDVLFHFELNDLVDMMYNPENLVYLSTNSRSLLPKETAELHRNLIVNLCKASEITGRDFLIISRGDSTMRGHFPLESDVIYEQLKAAGRHMRGEVFCPYLDGVRKTINDVHYVLQDDKWIPCAETEFAKDATFGYSSSNLREYIYEKTGHPVPYVSIGVELLNGNHEKEITDLLKQAPQGTKIVVNATCMDHLNAFVCAIEPVKSQYQYRTAASFVKAFAKVTDQPYLNMNNFSEDIQTGGLILVGSHVKKTTDQVECLMACGNVVCFEYDVLKDAETQLLRLAEQTNHHLSQGHNVLIMTTRERQNFPGDFFEQLMASRKISEEFVSVLQRLTVRPKFLISKGGITSYDVLKKGLSLSRGRVLGQVEKNIPVVLLSEDALYPGMPVVVFPGNVGDTQTLKSLVR